VSSSSLIDTCVCDLFNPDTELRVLPSLTVVTQDSSEIPIPAGNIVLAPGANIEFILEETEDILTIAAKPGAGIEDPYYRQKYEALASLSESDTPSAPVTGPFLDPGSGLTPVGAAWTFSYLSLWIAKFNQVAGDAVSGAFFFVGDECFGVGEFEDTVRGYPQAPRPHEYGSSSSGSGGAELAFLDICHPCLDCGMYQQLEAYLERIKIFYDYIYELIDNLDPTNPPEHPDGGIRTDWSGLLQQYLTAARYWDHLLHGSTIKLSAQGQGQSIVASGFYRNVSDQTIGAGAGTGVQLTLAFEFQKDGCPWEGISNNIIEVRALARTGKQVATLVSTVFTDGGLPPGCPSGPGQHTVTANMQSGVDLGPNDEVYADIALLIANTDLFEEAGADFTVQVTLCVQQTHLSPVIQCRTETVYFRPTNAPGTSDIGGSSL